MSSTALDDAGRRERELQRALRDAMDEHRSVGAVSAWWNGRDLVTAAEGVVELGRPDAVTDETLFALGSVTKLFTAFIILQLVDEGALTLDDRVIDRIPEFRYTTPGVAERVLVRQLLTHSGGTPDGFFAADSVAEILAVIADQPALCEPGAIGSYSNIGYALLGEIIERATGKPYLQNVQERLLDPLGLTRSRALTPEIRALGAPDHRTDPATGELQIADMWPRVGDGMVAAGSTFYSSAPELALIVAALSTGQNPTAPGAPRMLSEELVAEALHRHVALPGIGLIAKGLGLGWLHPRQPEGRRVVSHGGGTSIVVFVDLDSGDVVVTATNFDEGEQVGGRVARAVIGAPSTPPAPTDRPSDAATLSRVTGRWGVGPLENTIRLDGDRLVMELMGESVRLIEVDPQTFLLTASGLHLDLVLLPGRTSAEDWIHLAGRALERRS
ncbi:beta-lactamase family protein [Microbacterium aerolatum]|uniref:serine hydrolase domain-containing protein n=1 Tax=Microbacterium aerolatum TaxID=153731 RepID=UPI00384DD00B